ncbi:hypothetical protein Poli38472_002277 [Pythium oligandrum]|uniref:Uncharacterized protein n=1 Tax=Pythium oligandrum TaxID=41045 RepID=A0A8K1CGX6_PYTOL|nr:hypothetical protein Poli38472_002277 [Pythium oligandrum]|eukprot:TMW63336.1 hypothetical protein Poli38472_002277 [Pythium oligandrum]
MTTTEETDAVSIQIIVEHPVLLAQVLACVGSRECSTLLTLNKQWARELLKPVVWEILAGMPYQPLLSTCFRRAASYCYREIDVPSPNVNRRGSPPVIRSCLLNERSSIRDYVRDLRVMSMENKWFDTTPRVFRLNEVAELSDDSGRNNPGAFQNLKILTNDVFSMNSDTRILSGSMDDGRASFYLWSLKSRRLRASMTQTSAACYHYCNDALAVGCADGSVKVWDFNSLESRNFGSRAALNASPTASISHRSGIGLMPFLRPRSRDRVVSVYVDHNDGTLLHMATSTEKGEANVWDVMKGEMLMTVDANKIHRSALPRAQREAQPQVTSLMLFRNTLVCGTSSGLIRVYDLRSGRLTHRLAGHPDSVMKTDTKGRVLWSAGREGSVRWWGGKTAKVLSKSAVVEGRISALEMDDTVVVAGYSTQGMEAWDVRTQQSLCTFSNAAHGGVQSLQFDSRKIVTVSSTGAAALWRWYSPNPVRWFTPPASSTRIVSAQFNDSNLLLGTDCGELLDYDRKSLA